ncbi:hypothetical protein F4808DRAFT_435846 [Astrocystis sublimbata]|nr:hypothetical protein F4808DRAFT_435846 [Astrocystis sublimbata]
MALAQGLDKVTNRAVNGVDFDWGYPGDEDCGGFDVESRNFTALVEELRAAIKASGRQ